MSYVILFYFIVVRIIFYFFLHTMCHVQLTRRRTEYRKSSANEMCRSASIPSHIIIIILSSYTYIIGKLTIEVTGSR